MITNWKDQGFLVVEQAPFFWTSVCSDTPWFFPHEVVVFLLHGSIWEDIFGRVSELVASAYILGYGRDVEGMEVGNGIVQNTSTI